MRETIIHRICQDWAGSVPSLEVEAAVDHGVSRATGPDGSVDWIEAEGIARKHIWDARRR